MTNDGLIINGRYMGLWAIKFEVDDQLHVRDLRVRIDENFTIKQSEHVSMKICKSYGQNPEMDPNY